MVATWHLILAAVILHCHAGIYYQNPCYEEPNDVKTKDVVDIATSLQITLRNHQSVFWPAPNHQTSSTIFFFLARINPLFACMALSPSYAISKYKSR